METSLRAHKPKSTVWKYYESDVKTNGKPVMKCRFCWTEFCSQKPNATKLRQHLIQRCLRISTHTRNAVINESNDKDNGITSEEISYNNCDYNQKNANEYNVKSEAKTKSKTKSRVVSKDTELDIKSDLTGIPIISQLSKLKTLEEENSQLSSRLRMCLKQNEALIQITKHLDKSLDLMIKLDSINKNQSFYENEEEVEDLTEQLNKSNKLAKEWKQKLRTESDDKIGYPLNDSDNNSVNSVNYYSDDNSIDSSANNSAIDSKPKTESTIMNCFEKLDEESSDAYYVNKCLFCDKIFRQKTLNICKFRTHIVENCGQCPQYIRDRENIAPKVKCRSRVDVWEHFILKSKDGKCSTRCKYCGITYRIRNATKSRRHLAFRCTEIPDEIKQTIRKNDENLSNNPIISNKTKISNIWKHFDINEETNGKTSCRCNYCGFTYNGNTKNATKCRSHLTDRCDQIPDEIRKNISIEAEETARTWTQTKTSVWEHFVVKEKEGKSMCRCVYCGFTYANKNATKCRIHIMFKCDEIPIEKRESIQNECKESALNALLANKIKSKPKISRVKKVCVQSGPKKLGRHKSEVWQHFTEDKSETGNTIRSCLYCKTSFSLHYSQNATKMRDHLTLECNTIPIDIKQSILDLFDDMNIFQCCWPGCELKFTKNSRLLKHQSVHLGVVHRVTCDWPGCEWTGRDQFSLKIHRYKHTGEKPFKCNWPGCEFRTDIPSTLSSHKLRHNNIKKYQCEWPECERAFLTNHQRTIHKLVHTGLRPYKCQLCDKRYPLSYKLKVHFQKQHSKQ